MLWDVIRDFFVMYIFGGNSSDGSFYGGLVGYFCDTDLGYGPVPMDSLFFKLGNDAISQVDDSIIPYINFGDWLSTTFTIITLILICYMFLRLIIWLFKFGAGLFKW